MVGGWGVGGGKGYEEVWLEDGEVGGEKGCKEVWLEGGESEEGRGVRRCGWRVGVGGGRGVRRCGWRVGESEEGRGVRRCGWRVGEGRRCTAKIELKLGVKHHQITLANNLL